MLSKRSLRHHRHLYPVFKTQLSYESAFMGCVVYTLQLKFSSFLSIARIRGVSPS